MNGTATIERVSVNNVNLKIQDLAERYVLCLGITSAYRGRKYLISVITMGATNSTFIHRTQKEVYNSVAQMYDVDYKTVESNIRRAISGAYKKRGVDNMPTAKEVIANGVDAIKLAIKHKM